MNTPRRLLISLAATSIIVTSTGCASSSYGTKLDRQQVQRIEKGKSTRADVEALIGPCPNPSMASPDGSRMLTYHFSEAQAQAEVWRLFIPFGLGGNGMDATTHQQFLTIYIAPSGIVKDYEFSETTADSHQDVSVFGGGHATTAVHPMVSQAR